MTEKRFQWRERIDIGYVDEFVIDTFTNKELDEEDMCDLLNELNNENDALKQQLKTKHIVNKQYEALQKLKEENQYLRELLDIGKTNAKDIVDVLNAQQNAIKELTKENKKLKEKHNKKKIKDALSIAEWMKNNIKYGYYDNSSDAHKWLEDERRRALNCSDRDKVDLNRKRR